MRLLPSPNRCCYQPLVIGALLLIGAAAQAQTRIGDALVQASPRLDVESLPYSLQSRATEFGAARGLTETPRDGLRTRVWWGKGVVELGAGADVSNSNLAPGLMARQAGTGVVGLRAELTPGAHLAIERDANHPALQRPGVPAAVDASRLALEFKGVGNSKAASPLSGGLLRVQMSGSSTLQFKPRSGGMSVTYRAKF